MKQIIKLLVLFLALPVALAACGGSSNSPPAAVNNVAFITSVSGNANLSSWGADAGGLTGLAAGNAICQARATAAGLPGTYRAWISTSTTDAYCNILGLSGKLSGNCGGVSPLPLAGPWVRTDGTRFAQAIDILTASPWIVYTPLNYDEFGNVMSATYTAAFTNTDQYGVMFVGGVPPPDYNACSDWTDGTTNDWSVAVVGGEAPYTSPSWATGYGFTCDYAAHLLCLQTGAGIPLPAVTTTGKKVFVTSEMNIGDLTSWTSYSGSATGAAAGDKICQNLAQIALLDNYANFKAWLSDSGTNAIDRLTSTGPWVRIDGIMVAHDKTALTNGLISGLLFTSISQDESGNYVSTAAWTGTNSDGTKNLDTCNDWADGTISFNGEYGGTYSAAVNWTQSSNMGCNSTQPIYCFED